MKIAMHKCVLWARAYAIQYLLGNGSATSITGPVWRPAPTRTPSPVSKRIFMRGGAARDHEELL